MKPGNGIGRRMRLVFDSDKYRAHVYAYSVCRMSLTRETLLRLGLRWPTDMEGRFVTSGAVAVRMIELKNGPIRLRWRGKSGGRGCGIYICRQGFERATGLKAPKSGVKHYALILAGSY